MNPDRGNDQKEQERRNDGANVPITKDDPQHSDTQSIAYAKQDQKIGRIEDELRRGERWIIALTGAIALFALGSLVASILQWVVMRGQLDVMKDQLSDARASAKESSAITDRQLGIAESQAVSLGKLASASVDAAGSAKESADDSGRIAKAAETSTKVATTALRTTERAYLAVQAVVYLKDFDGKARTVNAIIANTGRTPAYKMHLWSYSAIGRNPEAFDGNLPFWEIKKPASEDMIAGGHTAFAQINVREMTTDQIASIKTGTAAIYAWARVEYTDVFHAKQCFRYCYYVTDLSTGAWNACPNFSNDCPADAPKGQPPP
jgi:hypothetical protein